MNIEQLKELEAKATKGECDCGRIEHGRCHMECPSMRFANHGRSYTEALRNAAPHLIAIAEHATKLDALLTEASTPVYLQARLRPWPELRGEIEAARTGIKEHSTALEQA